MGCRCTSTGMTGSWAGVEVPVALAVRPESPLASPLAARLLEVEDLEELLALPGDRTRGERSTRARISTLREGCWLTSQPDRCERRLAATCGVVNVARLDPRSLF